MLSAIKAELGSIILICEEKFYERYNGFPNYYCPLDISILKKILKENPENLYSNNPELSHLGMIFKSYDDLNENENENKQEKEKWPITENSDYFYWATQELSRNIRSLPSLKIIKEFYERYLINDNDNLFISYHGEELFNYWIEILKNSSDNNRDFWKVSSEVLTKFLKDYYDYEVTDFDKALFKIASGDYTSSAKNIEEKSKIAYDLLWSKSSYNPFNCIIL